MIVSSCVFRAFVSAGDSFPWGHPPLTGNGVRLQRAGESAARGQSTCVVPVAMDPQSLRLGRGGRPQYLKVCGNGSGCHSYLKVKSLLKARHL